jgi:hypothetical protein
MEDKSVLKFSNSQSSSHQFYEVANSSTSVAYLEFTYLEFMKTITMKNGTCLVRNSDKDRVY